MTKRKLRRAVKKALTAASIHALAVLLVIVTVPSEVQAATFVGGYAYTVRANVAVNVPPVIAININQTINLVTLPPNGGGPFTAGVNATIPAILTTGTVLASTTGTANPTTATATSFSRIENLSVLGGLVTATLLNVNAATACDATSATATPTATFVDLNILSIGVGLNPLPNTVFALVNVGIGGGLQINGSVVLNEQITSLTSTTASLTMNIIRISGTVSIIIGGAVVGTVDITIASAASNVNCSANATPVDTVTSRVTRHPSGNRLQWQTGYEVDNLGFNIYRDDNGRFEQINRGLIAGSSLMTSPGTALTAGQSYAWWDDTGGKNAKYLIEEIDTSGQKTFHGPVNVGPSTPADADIPILSRNSPVVSDLQRESVAQTVRVEPKAVPKALLDTVPTRGSRPTRQASLAGLPAVKIGVKREGWYRVRQPDLVAAGLDPAIDPRRLQLFADGKQVAVTVTGQDDGRFDSADALEFFGIGVDTPWTDTHIYWLVSGRENGLRVERVGGPGGAPNANSFPYTVEREERVVYFSGLINGDEENFFGAVVSSTPRNQTLQLRHVDTGSSVNARLEIALQGATTSSHRTRISLNDSVLTELAFEGQSAGLAEALVPHSALRDGDNVIKLESLGGPSDLSLVKYVRLTYQHVFRAEDNELHLSAPANSTVRVDGFNRNDIRVLDVTDPDRVTELLTTVTATSDGYAVTSNTAGAGERRLVALTIDRIAGPASLERNHPSDWRSQARRFDLLVIGHESMLEAVEPLVEFRRGQGLRVAVIDVEDLYDEFNGGHKSPYAIREFLTGSGPTRAANTKFVLLVGDASLDPRNYIGVGDFDFVPTKFIATGNLETVSDDWFVDFNDDGLPEMAIGRLPVRTTEAAERLVAKTLRYEQMTPATRVTLVSDVGDVFDFQGVNNQVKGLIPGTTTFDEVDRGKVDSETARQKLFESINRGTRLVNYVGHGSRDTWRGNVLTSSDAPALTNTQQPTFVVAMACLNGLFQDTLIDSLAESLVLAEGGAAVVWASSGMTNAGGQARMNVDALDRLFGGRARTIGEATLRAKASTEDADVRRTWILFGDPSTRFK